MTVMTDIARSQSRLFSILSLVSAIIGAAICWTGWGILLPIAAVVFGLIGARRERSARVFWLTGILLGVVGIVVSVVSLFLQYLTIMAVAGFTAG